MFTTNSIRTYNILSCEWKCLWNKFLYILLKVVIPISLLFFWTDLWYILFGIYTTIESYIAGEKVEGKNPNFDSQNYAFCFK